MAHKCFLLALLHSRTHITFEKSTYNVIIYNIIGSLFQYFNILISNLGVLLSILFYWYFFQNRSKYFFANIKLIYFLCDWNISDVSAHKIESLSSRLQFVLLTNCLRAELINNIGRHISLTNQAYQYKPKWSGYWSKFGIRFTLFSKVNSAKKYWRGIKLHS